MKTIDEELNMKFAADKHRFIANLVFTSNWFEGKVTEFLKPYKISQQQWNVLRILKGNGDWMTMNDVKKLMIDKFPNATRLSDKLLEKGYIERERCSEDRRLVYVKISNTGIELLKQLDEDPQNDFLCCLDSLTDEEARMVSTILDKMRNE